MISRVKTVFVLVFALLAIACSLPINQDAGSQDSDVSISHDDAVYLLDSKDHPDGGHEETDEEKEEEQSLSNPCEMAKEAARQLADGSTIQMLTKMMNDKIAALKAQRKAKCDAVDGWFQRMTCHGKELVANIKAGVAAIKDEFLPAIKAAKEAKAPLVEKVKELSKACLAHKAANPAAAAEALAALETGEGPEDGAAPADKDDEDGGAEPTPCDLSRAAAAELADGSIIRMLTTMMHDKITDLKARRKAKCDAVAGFFARVWCHGTELVRNVKDGVASIKAEFMPAIQEAWAKKAELREKVKELSKACVAYKVANPGMDIEFPQ